MRAVDFFEELRFILELLIAEHLFAGILGKRRGDFRKRVIPGAAILILWASSFPFVYAMARRFTEPLAIQAINTGWYATLTLCTVAHIKSCYRFGIVDTLFICTAGYSLQHIEFVLVNELLAKGVWTTLPDNLPIYVIQCVGTTVILYALVYRIFRKHLSGYDGKIFKNTRSHIAFAALMFALLVTSTFMCQHIFVSGRVDYEMVNYLGAYTDVCICILVLGVQYGMCAIHQLNQENYVIEQLLYERKRQYEIASDKAKIINQKCHDLKHQLQALQEMETPEKAEYIEELKGQIDVFDSVIHTGNEVLDTILSEKSLSCEQRQIHLSCVVDAGYLDFISVLDLYALMGNALDNAIEHVSKYEDPEKRVISLNIRTIGEFLSIQTNNYFEGDLQFEDGLPLTNKSNKAYHGFGMKSMRFLAEKYGGSLVADVKDQMFTLQILLPMPKEFLRLYALKMEQEG